MHFKGRRNRKCSEGLNCLLSPSDLLELSLVFHLARRREAISLNEIRPGQFVTAAVGDGRA